MPEQFYKERIRSLMNERGWNQSVLAREAKLSQSVLSRFFSGETKELDVAQLGKVAVAFGVLPGDLLPHSDMPVAPEAFPFMRIVAGQPAALRHQLERMAQMMVATWTLARQESDECNESEYP